jgi:hypothetical protein
MRKPIAGNDVDGTTSGVERDLGFFIVSSSMLQQLNNHLTSRLQLELYDT